MPYALKEAGFYGGMALILIVACCSDYTVRKIVALGVRAKRKYYEDLCASQFGHSGYVFVVGAMGIFAYGAMVAYLMGIGDNMSIVVSSWSGTDLHANPWIKRVTLSAISVGAVLPLALLRNMSALSKTSALSISAVLFIILVVLKNATFGAGDAPVPVKESDKALLLIDSNFFPAVGVIAFAFVCHHACFIVYNTLRDNTEARWAKTVHATLGVATSVMFVLAVGAFITFRGLTKGSFLTNYSYTDPLCNIMRCLFAVAQTLTYPLELFVARHATHALMFPAQKWTNEQHYTITLLLWGCVEAVRARKHVMPCSRLTSLRPVSPLPCAARAWPSRSTWRTLAPCWSSRAASRPSRLASSCRACCTSRCTQRSTSASGATSRASAPRPAWSSASPTSSWSSARSPCSSRSSRWAAT